MSREVAALESLFGKSVPRVIEHNTNSFEVPYASLYVILEFIEGPTLSE